MVPVSTSAFCRAMVMLVHFGGLLRLKRSLAFYGAKKKKKIVSELLPTHKTVLRSHANSRAEVNAG